MVDHAPHNLGFSRPFFLLSFYPPSNMSLSRSLVEGLSLMMFLIKIDVLQLVLNQLNKDRISKQHEHVKVT